MNLLQRRRGMMGAKEPLPNQPIGENLITSETLNYLLDVNTGLPVSDNASRYCDYIPIYPKLGYNYMIKHPTNRTANLCFYDKDKVFITGGTTGSGQNNVLSNYGMTQDSAFVRASTSKTGASGSTTFEIYRFV